MFAGPLVAPQPLATYIDRHRTTEYGTVTITNLELVRYYRTHQTVTIVSYAQAALC